MKPKAILVLLACCWLLPQLSLSVSAQEFRPGQDVVKAFQPRTTPLGNNAAAVFARIKGNGFQKNIDVSNQWIKAQLAAIDRSNRTYKAYVAEMVEGDREKGILGMRSWLTDEKNLATWDKTVQRNAGDDGYARVVALNAAFPPGSDEYHWVYGGVRTYNPQTNMMTLNRSERAGVPREKVLVTFKEGATGEQRMDTLVKFGDAIRQQMFKFYQDYSDGKITQDQVTKFNEGYIWAGGCAMAATQPESAPLAFRYLNALNLMAVTLNDLGYKVAP